MIRIFFFYIAYWDFGPKEERLCEVRFNFVSFKILAEFFRRGDEKPQLDWQCGYRRNVPDFRHAPLTDETQVFFLTLDVTFSTGMQKMKCFDVVYKLRSG